MKRLSKQSISLLRETAYNNRYAGLTKIATALELLIEWHDQQASSTCDLASLIHRQRSFSQRVFGPGKRTAGICDHIRKELNEIEAAPGDLMEWVDVILLAIDGAWRAGWTPEDIAVGVSDKIAENEGRSWPDWRTADPDKAIEHDRSQEGT